MKSKIPAPTPVQDGTAAEPVRDFFMKEAAKIPARTEFVFTPNGLGLDPQRLMAISYQHHQQRLREAGLD